MLSAVVWFLCQIVIPDLIAVFCCSVHLQLFFKRSTLYVPFILVGAYFANEVRSIASVLKLSTYCCSSVVVFSAAAC